MLLVVDEFCGEQRYRCARWLPLRSFAPHAKTKDTSMASRRLIQKMDENSARLRTDLFFSIS
jgi:hypothetical protein